MRGILEWLAWKVLRDQVRDHYVMRAEVVSYCWWMSRDFPVFIDAMRYMMFLGEDNEPVQSRDVIENHRQKMRLKHQPPATDGPEGGA